MIWLEETPPEVTNKPLLVLKGRTEVGATIYMGLSMAWPDAAGEFTLEFPLKEGVNGLVLKVQDVAGNWNQTVLTVTLDVTSPTLTITSPDDGEITNEGFISVSGVTEEEP